MRTVTFADGSLIYRNPFMRRLFRGWAPLGGKHAPQCFSNLPKTSWIALFEAQHVSKSRVGKLIETRRELLQAFQAAQVQWRSEVA